MNSMCRTATPQAGKSEENGHAAFTLTELLVIIAVVAILAVLQCAAWAAGRGRTRVAACSGHLRRFDLALQLFGKDHNDHLPPVPGPLPPYPRLPGNWPWDLAVQVTDQIAPYGATRNVLYCPANPDFNNDLTWNFSTNSSGGGFRIIGYVVVLRYMNQIPTQYQNATLTPQAYYDGGTYRPAPLPSQRVLLADATISYNGRYDSIPIGGLPPIILQRTSHLDGGFPAGGNIGMLDGHVEWREFSDMHVAFGTPTFHW